MISIDPSERGANRGTDRTLFPGDSEAPRRSGLATDSALAVVAGAGLLGRAVTVALAGGHPLLRGVLGTAFGSVSGALASRHLTTPGQALVRGLGLAVFAWVLALAVLGVVRGRMGTDPPVAFPLFVRLVVGLGVPVGVVVGLTGTPNWSGLKDGPQPVVSGVISGGVSAVSGGSLFGGVMTGNRTARLLGGVVGSEGTAVVVVLYLGIAAAIGSPFGLLFGVQLGASYASLNWAYRGLS